MKLLVAILLAVVSPDVSTHVLAITTETSTGPYMLYEHHDSMGSCMKSVRQYTRIMDKRSPLEMEVRELRCYTRDEISKYGVAGDPRYSSGPNGD